MKKLAVLFALLLTAAFAQQDASLASVEAESVLIEPQSIVVNPKPEFGVDIFVDNDPSGNSIPRYSIGEGIVVNVRTSADAYVYLYNVRSNGSIVQFMPNSLDKDNFVRAGQVRTFPPAGARYQLTVDGPSGTDKIIALASKRELNVSQLASISNDPNFATSNAGQDSFARSMSIIVTPLPQAAWVTDTVLFSIGNAPAPQIGVINVSSNPTSAAVYVDNRFRGYTPLQLRTSSGSHNIRIDRAGYQSFQQSVSVAVGSTVNVTANLSANNAQGTAFFRSNPAGAQVYVNGNYVGVTPTSQLNFAPGTYTARFVLAGATEQSVSFSVSANRNTEVATTLVTVPQEGSVFINTNVANARVFINGTDYGTTNGRTGRVDNLPVGRHQLVVLAPGYNAYVSEFTVTASSANTMTVSLSRR